MTTENSGERTPKGERALRWIGDLDHPFYNDERQRFVWYEASAIAFQLFVLSTSALVGAMLWIGGSEAFPYAIAVLVLHWTIALVAFNYAKRNYAEYQPQRSDLTSRRGWLVLALSAFLGSGIVRALSDGSEDGLLPDSFSEAAGFAVGFASVVGAVAGVSFAMKWYAAKTAKAEHESELEEF